MTALNALKNKGVKQNHSFRPKSPKQKEQNGILAAYGALLLATAIWGAATVVIKITLNHIPLFSFLFYRFLIVGIVLLPFTIWELKKTKIDPGDFPALILLGLTGQTGILLIFAAVKYTTATDAAIIGAVAPLMIVAAGHYFYKEKINKTLELGLLVATVGTLIVVLEPILTGSHSVSDVSSTTRLLGNILAVVYNVSFAGYIIISKKVMGERSKKVSTTLEKLKIKPLKSNYTPFLHTSISFYVALASFIPFALLEKASISGTPEDFSIFQIDPVGLVGLFYMAIISSIVAYVAFQWGLERARVSDSALFSYLGPLFTIPIAFILLGEVPSSFAILGTAVIACGVVLAEFRRG